MIAIADHPLVGPDKATIRRLFDNYIEADGSDSAIQMMFKFEFHLANCSHNRTGSHNFYFGILFYFSADLGKIRLLWLK